MHASWLLPIAVLLALASACHADQDLPAGAEEYAIYSAVVDSYFVREAQPVRIASRTQYYDVARALGETTSLYRAVRDSSGVSEELWTAYAAANRSPRELCDCFQLSSSVSVVPERTVPDSIGPVTLSAVGFDRDRAMALVWAAQSCGHLCGTSVLVRLEKQGTRWVIRDRVLTGAS
jgi:hypothetical protein